LLQKLTFLKDKYKFITPQSANFLLAVFPVLILKKTAFISFIVLNLDDEKCVHINLK